MKYRTLGWVIDQWRGSPAARRSAVNSAYNVADYVVAPLVMLLATPFFVVRLGLEQYGLWMLANAIGGTLGAFSGGLGDATTKYVSAYRARDDGDGAARIVRTTLVLYVALSLVLAGGLALSAPGLVRHAFQVAPPLWSTAVKVICLAGLGMVVRSLDSIFGATLRGYERYDLVARASIGAKVIGVFAAATAVAMGLGVIAATAAGILAAFGGVVAQALQCRRLMEGRELLGWADRSTMREVAEFSAFGWGQSVGAVLFTQADRLVVASMLGPVSLGSYSVCLQLAQQIHSLAAAAFHFVFPLVSLRASATARGSLRSLYRKSVLLNVALSLVLALPLVLWGRDVLSAWMGPAFARHTGSLLPILSAAFLLLSINVVPYNTLLGLGHVRIVSVMNLVGGLLSLAACIALIPVFGVSGAAMARLCYGPIVAINHAQAARHL